MSISRVVQFSIGNMWSHWGHFHDALLVKISWSWPRSKQLTSMEHHALATWQISRLWLKAPPKSSVQLNDMKVAKVVLPPRSYPRHDGTFQKGFTPTPRHVCDSFSLSKVNQVPACLLNPCCCDGIDQLPATICKWRGHLDVLEVLKVPQLHKNIHNPSAQIWTAPPRSDPVFQHHSTRHKINPTTCSKLYNTSFSYAFPSLSVCQKSTSATLILKVHFAKGST